MKRAKAGFIAEERPTGHGHAAGKKDVDGCVEPNYGDAGVTEKFGGSGLGIGAATEREDGRFLQFDGAAKSGAKLIGFELAEGLLAVTFEKLRDGDAGGGNRPSRRPIRSRPKSNKSTSSCRPALPSNW